jgi:membrane-bound serine protease (ClpP class)
MNRRRGRNQNGARLAWAFWLMLLLGTLCALALHASPARSYVEVRVDGVINPVKVRLVARAVERAEREHAEFLLVTIDTPGGLVVSMQAIVQSLSNARVPVVAFVEPRTAQATSAGAFVLLAADIASMAPGTRVGAAHPVADGKALEDVMDKKATSTLAALVRSLAERRGRPAELAESMVRESTSFTAEDALAKKLVELVVRDRAELLQQLDGRVARQEHKLSTRGLERVQVPPTAIERLLDQLADPTLASLLISIGMLGVLYEFGSPGVGAGGVVGAVLIVLGLLGSSVLALETTALVLFVIGAVGIGLEMILPAHGLIAGSGTIALLIGAVLLVDAHSYFGGVERVNLTVFAPVLVALALGLTLLLRTTRKALGAPSTVGIETLVGKLGVARTSFGRDLPEPQGMVFVDGARWQAETEDAEIPAGQSVEILAVTSKPTRLRVRRATATPKPAGSAS